VSATLALNRAGRQTRNELMLEEDKHDQRWNGDDDYICEEQVLLRAELADEAEQGQLRRDVRRVRQEVEWFNEVVVDANRRGDDHPNNGGLQQHASVIGLDV
jgi:hypothetical protein